MRPGPKMAATARALAAQGHLFKGLFTIEDRLSKAVIAKPRPTLGLPTLLGRQGRVRPAGRRADWARAVGAPLWRSTALRAPPVAPVGHAQGRRAMRRPPWRGACAAHWRGMRTATWHRSSPPPTSGHRSPVERDQPLPGRTPEQLPSRSLGWELGTCGLSAAAVEPRIASRRLHQRAPNYPP